MSSDYRMMQHHAAVATHGLTSAVEYLRDLFRQHPEIVAAEYVDIVKARHALGGLSTEIVDWTKHKRQNPAA